MKIYPRHITVRHVLSLSDGISVGQQALRTVGIRYDKYYSSEVDEYAMNITRYNHPDTIHLGNILSWKSWDLDWSKVDILFAGFPRQTWSVAGSGTGYNDPRSQLLWTMMDILNHIRSVNPDVKYIFENVKMKHYFMTYCTNAIGIQPILLDSSNFSGQSRKRYYWTNIHSHPVGLLGDYLHCAIPEPTDSGILLKDILEPTVPKKYYLSETMISHFNGKTIPKEGKAMEYSFKPTDGNKKSFTVTCREGQRVEGNFIRDEMGIRKITPLECERLQTLPDGYTLSGMDKNGKLVLISDTQRYKVIGNSWNGKTIEYILNYIKKGIV